MKHFISSILIALAIGPLSAQDGLIIEENSIGVCTMDGVIDSAAVGFTGIGYANIDNGVGIGMSWSFTVPSAGSYTFYIRYALGGADETSRDAQLIVNNIEDTTVVEFPHLNPDWNYYENTDTFEVELEAGNNNIRLSSITEKGLANLDHFKIMGASGIEPAECTPSFTFDVTSVNEDWGSVSFEPEQFLYNQGEEITVHAQANDGYFFHSWSGEEGSTDTNFTFQIKENTHLTGLFYPDGTTMAEGASGYATVQHDNGTPYLITGGAMGDTVRVDNVEDLISYLADPEPYIVILTAPIVGSNSAQISIASNKTLIGEGNAHIQGIPVDLQDTRNIIIKDMTFSKVVQFDAMEINSGSQNIWIDHCEFFSDRDHHQDYYDGLLDIKNGARYITVSRSKFHTHEKCILVSSGDQEIQDSVIRLTFHHNHFYNGGSRLPSIRFGKAHIFNNYYEGNGTAINSRMNACVRVEKNYFQNSGTGVGMMFSPTPGGVELIDNVFENTTYSESPTCELDVPYDYEDLLMETDDIPTVIPEEAGPRIPGFYGAPTDDVSQSNYFSNDLQVAIFPNPATDKATMIIKSTERRDVDIAIVDFLGKELITLKSQMLYPGENEMNLNTSQIQPGIYLCKVEFGSNAVVQKLVIR